MTTSALSLQQRAPRAASVVAEPLLVRLTLITISLAFLGVFLFLPLAAILFEALKHGLGAYLASFQEADAIAAIQLTLLTAAIAVPLNVVFGMMASWAVAKFEFRGKQR